MARRYPGGPSVFAPCISHQGPGGSLGGELRQELFALTGTETTNAALSGDPGALHDRSSAGLADARQRTDDLVDLRLAGEVIITAQHAGEREGACFHVGQQNRPGSARLARLRQRFLALLGGQGRQCHEGFLSVRRAGTAASRDVTPIMAGGGDNARSRRPWQARLLLDGLKYPGDPK
jgi:hypothetical protein